MTITQLLRVCIFGYNVNVYVTRSLFIVHIGETISFTRCLPINIVYTNALQQVIQKANRFVNV